MVFPTFLTFYTVRGSLDTKVQQKQTFSINGERLVAVEHAMFKFEGLKVNSRDDRQTNQQNDNLSTQLSLPMLKCGETNKLQQQIQHLMDLIQKLTVEFRAVKTEVEESRVDVNNICEILNDIIIKHILSYSVYIIAKQNYYYINSLLYFDF